MIQISRRALRPLAALALATAVVLPLEAAAQTAPPAMLRAWTAPPGGAISTVVIAGSPGAYTITITAPCSPTPCAWGTRPLTMYAHSAGSPGGYLGSAMFQQGFAIRTVIVTMNGGSPFLSTWVLTKFTGGGAGRSNYATLLTLH